MEKVLGIDLGTNSIGWAIREINNSLKNQIIDKGVMTFDKGVAEDKSGEHPMVQKRTESRSKRRNYQAEKYRKWALLKCLIEHQMCPLSLDELNDWRYYKKGVGRKYPQSDKFIQWLRFDFDGDGKPDFERLGFSKHESHYIFRALIVNEDHVEIFKNEPLITGRVLYQLVQRRGYNDGQNIDDADKDELSKTIMKGGDESGAIGVDNILPLIEQHKTLGAALYHLQKEQHVRIRKRYNLRSHYENEIREICRVQDIEHLFHRFWSAIIWQRPLRGQKGLVGICTYEKNKRRCPISHPLYEEYRTWVFINNLKIKPIEENSSNPYEVNQQLRSLLHDTVYPQFFKSAPDFKLSSISKELRKVGFEITARFPEDTKVPSVSFLYKMREVFGKEWADATGWNDLIEGKDKTLRYNIEDLWHLHFNKSDNKKNGKNALDFLKQFAIDTLGLTEEHAEVYAKVYLPQGYSTLSISAIKKILRYLREGFIYSEAVYLANLPKVLGLQKVDGKTINYFSDELRQLYKQSNSERKLVQVVNELISDHLNSEPRIGMPPSYQLDNSDLTDIQKKLLDVFGSRSWERLDSIERNNAVKYVSEKYLEFLRRRINDKNGFYKIGRLHNRIFQWIKDTYDIPDENIKHLWHPSEQELYPPAKKKDDLDFLESPEPTSKGFKNPMALKTLYKLKKLINYLLEVRKIDSDTRIVIEIARELNDANKRKAIQRWQRQKENENDAFKQRIDEINTVCGTQFDRDNKSLLDKIRLWEEQHKICIYTGKTITLSEVLNGAKYDFEHSIPASVSFDNELKNLTIADKKYNQQIKGKLLPSECPNFETEYIHEGTKYKPILLTLQSIFGRIVETERKIKGKIEVTRNFQKIIDLDKQYEELRSKTSEDKEIKDNIIIKRHLIKMELDYWRSKLQAFTIIEYKAGWRNSQLKDTQTITKYALPYLKTVFSKVDVQKGSITADFRKIYKIQSRSEKKERTKHSHHAVDAAVLTLIPSASIRDKILMQYNEAQENQQSYHAKPRFWESFHAQYILDIHDEVLINFQAQHRTLTPTYKTVRKRGRVQYVKKKLPNGKWQYKLDENGNQIPLIAQGDSIRGQLHKESFFGAIKNKGNQNLVERYPIASFANISDCRHIVDDAVRKIVTQTLEKRMKEGLSFDKAKLQPVPFPSGKEIIIKVRCKVAAGRGYLTPEKALEIQRPTYSSKHDYKNHVYARNEQNVYCLYYHLEESDKIHRAFRLVGLFELAKLGFKSEGEFYQSQYYQKYESGKGEKKKQLLLCCILKAGIRIIFYQKHIEELKELSNKELLNRFFRIYKFNDPSTIYIYAQNHIEARSNEELGNGDSDLNLEIYQPRVFLTANKFTAAIEGIHFDIMSDGEIRWTK